MEMCGHATVGAVWMLERTGALQKNNLRILTRSGPVDATVMRSKDAVWVEVSQEQGVVHILEDRDGLYEDIVSTLGIAKDDLIPGYAIHNCKTSRIKTAIPIKSSELLHRLKPRFQNVKGLCERIGSTGLYPYSITDASRHIFDARQFPKSSGYNEDAATGIAASALSFVLLENRLVGKNASITIRQGQAMGAPSQIGVRFRINDNDMKVNGCWIRGTSILTDI
jgi:PhzF family phenazine biosynthesis protein